MPIIWITSSFFAGVIAADALSWGVFAWILFGVGGSLTLGGFLWLKFPGYQRLANVPKVLILSLFVAFTAGGIRYLLALPDFQDPGYLTNYADKVSQVTLTGLIIDFPDSRDQMTNLRVKTEYIQITKDGEVLIVHGLLLAKIKVEEQVQYGDRVVLTGYLETPPEGEEFSYRDYLKHQGIYVYLPNAEVEIVESGQGNILMGGIFGLKSRAMAVLYQLWPDPEASLLAGILLGVETGIPDHVQQAFRDTGTSHIIAISGFNITIVAGLFSRFFSRLLNPRQGAVAAVLGIGVYTLLVGADAAVVRAAVMGGLSIFAQQIGRRQHGLNAAALASLIMILLNPQLPWDVSFQLSLSATLGLILYADPFAQKFLEFSSRVLPLETAQRITQPVSEYILFTFAAQLATFPVMLFHFHSFSLSTFLANPAILPVQPPIMLAGGLALILGLIWFPLGKLTAPLVYPFVLYTIRVVEWFSTIPFKTFYTGEMGKGWVVLIYLVLAAVTFGGTLLTRFAAVLTPSLIAAGLGLALIVSWRAVFNAPDGMLHIFLLDVGTGSALYIVAPSGQNVLINGGPSPKRLSDHLGRRQPPFQKELNYLLIASPLEQDIDALAGILPRFPPDEVYWLGADSLCWEAENLRNELEKNNIQPIYGEPGQVLELGDGAKITVLSESRRGGTLLVEYKHFRAIFPFGITEEYREETRMGRDLGEVTLLLLADSGYQSSNPSRWIRNLNPQSFLLSVGIKDSLGLPDRGLIDRLAGYSLLRTDQHGSIQITTDGVQMWVQVEKLD
ncbi:MAG: ComEC/Rec2 family competence protein [Anaerolineales bacterium]|nr:ComEC/Rec2 family competence protein [Anaerolineales bacterium]